MQSTMMTTPLNLHQLLARGQRLFPDSEIVSRRPDTSLHRYHYADMADRATRLASALLGAGLRPGDRVATLMWNHFAHLEAYFGIPAAGGVLHTLNLRLHPDDLAYIADHASGRFLIVDDILLPVLETFRDRTRFERIIVVPFDGRIDHEYEQYESFLRESTGDLPLPELDEDAPCGMCYTSGTTGRPKGVVYSHRSSVLHALGLSLPDSAGLSMRDTVLPIVPMFHANAWGLPYAATMTGCTQVFPGPHLDAENLLDLICRTGVTISGGVPTVWMAVLDSLRREPQRWSVPEDLRLLVGGSAVPPSMIQAFADQNVEVLAAWGLTETSPLASVSRLNREREATPPDQQLRIRASAGLPLPLVDLRLIGEDTEAPRDGASVGEIEVRGPWVTARYHDHPQSADRFSPDGWFRSGDVASLTPDGYIHITDRAKDLVKSGGEWISSQALENELMAHPDVAEAAVIAVPHQKWMERPLAVVVLEAGASATTEQLRSHLAESFPTWWLPDDVVFVDEIPRTSTGKFQKLKLREMFPSLPGQADPPTEDNR